jgi:uncharacterized protein HemX
VAEVRAGALAMAAQSRTADIEQRAPGKGEVPTDNAARHATAGGIIVAGGTAAQQAHHAGADPVVVAAIVIAAVAIAAGCWLAWRWHRRRQQQSN